MPQDTRALPLCVDLDGTLSRTNSIAEQIVALLRTRPWNIPMLLVALSHGRPAFKRTLQKLSPIENISLPFHPGFVAYAEAEAARGREVMLVTAADQSTATHVASLFPFLREGVGSAGNVNLSGKMKGDFLSNKYGKNGFVYAGNEARDVRVWEQAGGAVVVNPSHGLAAHAARVTTVERVFEDRPPLLPTAVRSLRPHQWLKNILIFVPVFTAHRLSDDGAVAHTLIAFVAFCAAASGAYVFNDLMDIPADRAHASKKNRPFASGDLPAEWGAILLPLLLGLAAVISLWLPVSARLLLAAYLVLTLLYTFLLKKLLFIDVLVLASLYAIRLVMGHLATGIAPSQWLIAFALYIFISLALLKRYCELLDRNEGYVPGRGYHTDYRSGTVILGVTSGCMAGLIMAPYALSAHVQTLYAKPAYLLILCPLFLLWILRMWRLGYRGKMHEDPVLFTLHDLFSIGVGALTILVVLLAR